MPGGWPYRGQPTLDDTGGADIWFAAEGGSEAEDGEDADAVTGGVREAGRDLSVNRDLVCEITGTDRPRFAIIETDCFGGIGTQCAVAFEGEDRLTPDQASINQALAALGVRAASDRDEFDVIGLGRFRSHPDYLDTYVQLCEELGV